MHIWRRLKTSPRFPLEHFTSERLVVVPEDFAELLKSAVARKYVLIQFYPGGVRVGVKFEMKDRKDRAQLRFFFFGGVAPKGSGWVVGLLSVV